MSSRSRIEQADMERRQNESQKELSRERADSARAIEVGNQQKIREQLSKNSLGYFDEFLMPLFAELARVNGVRMDIDPYKSPSFLWFSTGGSNSFPQRNGFTLSVSDETYGELIWDHSGGEKPGWRELGSGVTSNAIVSGIVGNGINLLSPGGQLKFEESFLFYVKNDILTATNYWDKMNSDHSSY